MPIEQGLSYCYVILWAYLLVFWRIRLKYRLYLFLSNLLIFAVWKLIYMKYYSIHLWFFLTAIFFWLTVAYFLQYHESESKSAETVENHNAQ